MRPGDVLLTHDRLWLGANEGDSFERRAQVQRTLGHPLPELLDIVFAKTALRSSQQLHLRVIEALTIKNGYLVFGADQQDTHQYALRWSERSESDPRVYSTYQTGVDFSPETGRLSDWLELFWVINRPFESPCADVALDDGLLSEWTAVQTPMASLALDADALYTRDGLVYARDMDMLGARTDAELRAFLEKTDMLEFAEVWWRE